MSLEEVRHILDPNKRRPGQRSDETKAQYFWRKLRQCVRPTVKNVYKADLKSVVIGHGVYHMRKVNHTEEITEVLFQKEEKEYLTITKSGINVFHIDGRKKDFIQPEQEFDRLVYAQEVNEFIGWCWGGEELLLLSEDFELISIGKVPHKIYAVVYNELCNEIVTTGEGNVTSWSFRYAAKHVIPRKMAKAGLTPQDIFTLLCLEETASRSQRAFAVCDTSVAVFNLHQGKLISYKKDLHVRSITSLLFFNPLKNLITAARDGSIKMWDESWHLKLVFVGHSGAISSLSVYPYGPYIMSASHDCTVRVWSLETCDEVDLIEADEPIDGLGTVLQADNVHSFSTFAVDLWRIRDIHTMHTAVGHKVDRIKLTERPEYEFPPRALLISRDATARIISPANGNVITSLIINPRIGIKDAIYAQAEDTVFAALKNGDMVRASAKTNPCTIQHTWKGSEKDEKKHMNCLCLYEYIVESTMSEDVWKGLMRSSKAAISSSGKPQLRGSDRTLVIGGRKDGYIAVLHWKTMKVAYKIEAHGYKGVIGLIANSKDDQLISAGLDNVIKVWRVFPFSQESLAPLMSFYCANTPLHMSVMRGNLMVAFQEASSATYSIVKYDILSKSRFDHSPDEDHIDDVNAMSCCARMRITASASSDGTVRIWNEANRLIRIIKLNATPLSVCFCSQKGDLLVGIGKHLHKIEHQKYMPRSYMLKMVSMRFPEVESEDPLPYDGDLLHDMNREDVKRLKNAHSSLYKFDHFVDVLTDEENEELTREKKVKEKEFALLANRDDELKQIRDGLFPLKKKPKPPPKVKEEAFKKYLELFPKPKQIFIPKDDYFNPNAFMDVSDEPGEPSFREFSPMGFFPNPKNTKLEEEEVEDEDGAKVTRKRPLPVNPSGFIPNSVLIRLLWPLDQTSKMKADTWRPPALSEDQVAEINARKRAEELAAALAAEEDDYDSERVFIWSDDDEELEVISSSSHRTEATSPKNTSPKAKKIEDMVEREEKEKSDLESASIKSTPKSGLFSKLAIDITRTPTPKEVSFDDFDDEPTPPPTPSPEIAKEEVKEQPKAVPKPKVVKIKKTITKFVSRPKPPPPSPSPPPQPTPSPPRLPTPLPGFISQFKGAEWFEKFFPNADSNTFPKPWTATAFSANLLKLEKIADYETKTQIADALMTLHNQDGLSNSKHIADTILGLLNTSNPPNAGESDQKAFILHSLRLLGSLAAENDDTVIEMMAQYLDGDEEIRNYVRNMFLHFGLQDPHNFFYKELDSWELWSLDDATNRKEELKVMASNWIDKWMEMFKSHISRTIELLKKGKVSAKISKAPSSRVKQASPSNSRGILKKDGEDSDNSDKGSIDGGDTDKISPRPPSQTKPLTVTFEAPPDQSTIDNAKPIEAINYFAEMQLEKQLEKMRSGTVSVSKSEKEELERRNTVLVLPKIKQVREKELQQRRKSENQEKRAKIATIIPAASKPSLVRLGETHTSKCRPHRETSLAAIEFKLPSLYPGKRIEYDGMYGFTPKIDLPMKTVVMNPFPSAADYYEELHQPILLTLKSSQKYFVPGHSYVRQAEMR